MMFHVLDKVIVGCVAAFLALLSYDKTKSYRKYAVFGFALGAVSFWMLALCRFLTINQSRSIWLLAVFISSIVISTIAIVNFGIYLSLYFKQKRAK